MNTQQRGILWIGILIVLVYLFTDQTFRDKIFGHGTSLTSAVKPTPPNSLTSILSGLKSVAKPLS